MAYFCYDYLGPPRKRRDALKEQYSRINERFKEASERWVDPDEVMFFYEIERDKRLKEESGVYTLVKDLSLHLVRAGYLLDEKVSLYETSGKIYATIYILASVAVIAVLKECFFDDNSTDKSAPYKI